MLAQWRRTRTGTSPARRASSPGAGRPGLRAGSRVDARRRARGRAGRGRRAAARCRRVCPDEPRGGRARPDRSRSGCGSGEAEELDEDDDGFAWSDDHGYGAGAGETDAGAANDTTPSRRKSHGSRPRSTRHVACRQRSRRISSCSPHLQPGDPEEALGTQAAEPGRRGTALVGSAALCSGSSGRPERFAALAARCTVTGRG